MMRIRWPKQQKRWLAKTAAMGVFIWAGWFFAVRPPLLQIRSFKRTTVEAEERSQLILDIQSLTKKQTELEGKSLDEENRHTILGKVTTLANTHGLNLKSIAPSLQPEGPYTKLTLALKGQASFVVWTKFVEEVEKMEPPLLASDMTISNQLGRYQQRETPDVELNLETYLTKTKKSG